MSRSAFSIAQSPLVGIPPFVSFIEKQAQDPNTSGIATRVSVVGLNTLLLFHAICEAAKALIKLPITIVRWVFHPSEPLMRGHVFSLDTLDEHVGNAMLLAQFLLLQSGKMLSQPESVRQTLKQSGIATAPPTLFEQASTWVVAYRVYLLCAGIALFSVYSIAHTHSNRLNKLNLDLEEKCKRFESPQDVEQASIKGTIWNATEEIVRLIREIKGAESIEVPRDDSSIDSVLRIFRGIKMRYLNSPADDKTRECVNKVIDLFKTNISPDNDKSLSEFAQNMDDRHTARNTCHTLAYLDSKYHQYDNPLLDLGRVWGLADEFILAYNKAYGTSFAVPIDKPINGIVSILRNMDGKGEIRPCIRDVIEMLKGHAIVDDRGNDHSWQEK